MYIQVEKESEETQNRGDNHEEINVTMSSADTENIVQNTEVHLNPTEITQLIKTKKKTNIADILRISERSCECLKYVL